MEVDIYLLLFFFFFFVLPLIQRMLGGGKRPPGQAPPGQRRPGQAPSGQRAPRRLPPQAERRPSPTEQRRTPEEWRPLPQPIEEADAPATAQQRQQQERSDVDRAAEMIPAELWEILTGERRPPVATPPEIEADVDEEWLIEREERPAVVVIDEDRAVDDLIRRRDEETAQRRAYDRELPTVISLETEPLPTPLRHEAFHRKVDQPGTHRPAIVIKRQRHTLLTSLRSGTELRRGIILREILGPPKGLD